ncbi:MAG: hypothetical protein FWE19_04870 [Oscillospiraceae bacterium]|nr:hypothetical protein [Oscillospiraceae bacterium]
MNLTLAGRGWNPDPTTMWGQTRGPMLNQGRENPAPTTIVRLVEIARWDARV